MDTSRIISKYKEHDSFFQETLISFKDKNVVHLIAHEILSDLSQRTNFIFEGLIELVEKDNLYSSFILYRSFLEHFYKSFFLFARTVKDNSDEMASKYQKHYFISEFLAEKAGILEMEELVTDSSRKTDFIKFIKMKMPDLEGFDKENQREISAAIKYFNVKAIVKFFYEDFSNNGSTQIAAIIAKTIPEYAHVSTFTHGGAYASNLIAKIVEQEKVEQELNKIISIALTCSCITKENIFSTYEPNDNFPDVIKRFQEIRLL